MLVTVVTCGLLRWRGPMTTHGFVWKCLCTILHIYNIHFHSYIHSQHGQGSEMKKHHSSVQNGIYMLRKDCAFYPMTSLSHFGRTIASPVNRNRIKSTLCSFSGGLWSGLLKKLTLKNCGESCHFVCGSLCQWREQNKVGMFRRSVNSVMSLFSAID